MTDPAFRARFRLDPAAASREAGLEAVANQFEAEAPPPLETVELRESRSNFAGVLLAGVIEGVALGEHIMPGLGAEQALAAGSSPSATPTPPEPASQADPGDLSQPARGERQIVSEGSSEDDEPDEEEPDEEEPDEEEPDEDDFTQPGYDQDEATQREPDDFDQPDTDGDESSTTGDDGDDTNEALSGSAERPPEPSGTWKPDSEQYGMAGGGGASSPLDAAVLKHPNITLDANGKEDFTKGRMDPRISAMLLTLADKHTVTLSSTTSDHPQQTAGGSTSNHWYGRGVDIATVDGEIVRPNSAASRKLASELIVLDASIRPDEVGSPWVIAAPGFFTDDAHQNHLHIAYDQAITSRWDVPAELISGGAPDELARARRDARVMPSVRRDEIGNHAR